MFSKILVLCLASIIAIAAVSPQEAPSYSEPLADLAAAVGGLFGSSLAIYACGIGVGALVGTAVFLTGGVAAIAATIIAPKAAAACILAVAL